MRWVIAGGRDFEDYDTLEKWCDMLLRPGDVILSGTARGADTLGEQYGTDHELSVEKYPADWDTHGKSAGYRRNHQMSLNADGLIAFWDGQSKGTKNMIECAHKARLRTVVVYYVQ